MRCVLSLLCVLLATMTAHALDIRQVPGYKEWLHTLQTGSDEQRGATAATIGKYGKDALPAFAALRLALRAVEAPAAVKQIVGALAAIGPAAHDALPDILEHLRKGELSTRDTLAALTALGDPTNAKFIALCLRRTLQQGDIEDDAPLRVCLRQAPTEVVPPMLQEAATDDAMRLHVLRMFRYFVLDESSTMKPARAHRRPILDWLPDATKETIVRFARTFFNDEEPRTRHHAYCLVLALQPTCIEEVFPYYFHLVIEQLNHLGPPTLYVLPVECCRFLINELGDPNSVRRYMAQNMLSRYTEDNVLSCLRYWREGLRHRQYRVILQLLTCIEHQSSMFAALHDDILVLLAHRDHAVQLRATECLLKNGVRHERMLPILTEALRNPQIPERQHALELIGIMGSQAHPLKPAIIRLHQHPSAGVRYDAARALAMIDPRASGTYLPVFARIWDQANGGPPHELLRALQNAGPHARSFLPRMRQAWDTVSGTETKLALAAAFIRVDPTNAQPMFDYLLASIQSNDVTDILQTIDTLRALGASAKPLVPQLLKLDIPQYAHFAVLLLEASIHLAESTTAPALERIRALLDVSDVVDRWGHLSFLGVHAKQLLPDLLRLVKKYPHRRITLCQLFGNLGADAAEAVPTLRDWAKDEAVAFEALVALRQIQRGVPRRP